MIKLSMNGNTQELHSSKKSEWKKWYQCRHKDKEVFYFYADLLLTLLIHD